MNPVFALFLIGLVFLTCSFWGLGFLFKPWPFTMLTGLFFVGTGTLILLFKKLQLELTAMDNSIQRSKYPEYKKSEMPPKVESPILKLRFHTLEEESITRDRLTFKDKDKVN